MARSACVMGVVLCLAFLPGALRAQVKPKPGPAMPPAKVIVTPVIQRELAAGQSFVGQVIPARRSVVGSAVDGRVVHVYVNDGDTVELVQEEGAARQVGQPIVQLLTETISIEVAAAKAALELRKHEMAEMEAGTRPEEIMQSLAKLEAAKAMRAYAEGQYERVKALYEDGTAAAKDEFEHALADSVSARQNLAAAQAAYEMAVKGFRDEHVAQARARLAMAQEEVRRLEDQQRKYTIRAPFRGYVVAKMTEVGAWISRGDPVAEVVELDPVEIDVTVPETYITHVRLGSQVTVALEALPGETFQGEVARIVPQADLRSRSFPVKIRMPNPQRDGRERFNAGQLARVTLSVGPLQQALLIPKDALVLGGPSPVVMAVAQSPDGQTHMTRVVPVKLGIAQDSLIQVTGDLKPGDQVVVVGNERVRPGQPIIPEALKPPAG